MQIAITLQAQPRELTGNKVRSLRRSGVVPAVIYGHNVPSKNLAVDAKTFEKVYRHAGESTLVDLKVGEAAPVKVLIQDVAKHHITLKPIHVDFYQVSMTEKLTADIPLKFIGEAPAVKELGGVLLKNVQEVKVQCLPQDLVHEIEVDIASLKTFKDAIAVKDLRVPSGIAILTKPEEVVALVQEMKAEEEVPAAPVDEKAAIEGIKVVAEEKKAEKEKEKGKEEEEKKEKK